MIFYINKNRQACIEMVQAASFLYHMQKILLILVAFTLEILEGKFKL